MAMEGRSYYRANSTWYEEDVNKILIEQWSWRDTWGGYGVRNCSLYVDDDDKKEGGKIEGKTCLFISSSEFLEKMEITCE